MADARFYRTVVPLDLSEGHDVSLAFEPRMTTRAKLRPQLCDNGYHCGKIIPYIGHQDTFPVFPVFPGIPDYHGDNTIGISIWAQDKAGGAVEVTWNGLGAHRSGFDLSFDSDYLRPGWFDRSEYA